jgi:hypothetical protein
MPALARSVKRPDSCKPEAVGLDATMLPARIRPSRMDAARGRERCACGIASVLVGYGTSTSFPFAAAATETRIASYERAVIGGLRQSDAGNPDYGFGRKRGPFRAPLSCDSGEARAWSVEARKTAGGSVDAGSRRLPDDALLKRFDVAPVQSVSLSWWHRK